ncbi:MAG: tyrosine-type recombinase/integrase [Anaerolineae bacterium]|jgi:integrase|nr:tyrosine-type recombinase/integrase [Anaerolineae bacterium]
MSDLILYRPNPVDQPNQTRFDGFAASADQIAAEQVFRDYRSRRSVNTLRAQDADLNLFAQFLSHATPVTNEELSQRPEAWRGVTWGIVEAFVKGLIHENYAVASVNRALSSVKKYCALAFKAGAIQAEEYALIKTVAGYSIKEGKELDKKRQTNGVPTRRQRPGAKKAQHTRISESDAIRLMKDHPDTPQGRRDRVLMCLLIELGLRCGEVARIRSEDVDLSNETISFYRPKVDKTQTHFIPNLLFEALKHYQVDMLPTGKLLRASKRGFKRKLESGETHETLPQLTHEGMTERGINKRVYELGRAIGIVKLSPHDLRHFWATDAARAGTDPFALQEAGGWNSLAMPRRYVDAAKIANEGLKRGRR